MGMKQKRCPVCKKRRPYNQGNSGNDTRRRNQNWSLIDGQMVCKHCHPVESPTEKG